ncbi:hypothetical protein GGX14DRAFT_572423 [Mycena pura]|uniref:Uncharacterized protein n=1 Tax=Mycena pura TaxID=153505 RepID=A0AAD6Y8Y2_9AGAR|nr:hypothetical protein GGX14DRAFT_572423 [Mycena pura]
MSTGARRLLDAPRALPKARCTLLATRACVAQDTSPVAGRPSLAAHCTFPAARCQRHITHLPPPTTRSPLNVRASPRTHHPSPAAHRTLPAVRALVPPPPAAAACRLPPSAARCIASTALAHIDRDCDATCLCLPASTTIFPDAHLVTQETRAAHLARSLRDLFASSRRRVQCRNTRAVVKVRLLVVAAVLREPCPISLAPFVHVAILLLSRFLVSPAHLVVSRSPFNAQQWDPRDDGVDDANVCGGAAAAAVGKPAQARCVKMAYDGPREPRDSRAQRARVDVSRDAVVAALRRVLHCEVEVERRALEGLAFLRAHGVFHRVRPSPFPTSPRAHAAERARGRARCGYAVRAAWSRERVRTGTRVHGAHSSTPHRRYAPRVDVYALGSVSHPLAWERIHCSAFGNPDGRPTAAHQVLDACGRTPRCSRAWRTRPLARMRLQRRAVARDLDGHCGGLGAGRGLGFY